MGIMKKYIILALTFFMSLQACETDFEVNAPWKNITVVYGLLNQNEKPHIIKINKAFLGEAAVSDMAAIADSSEYGADEITVTVERSKNGAIPDKVYALTRFTSSSKPSGTFYGPNQVLYKFSDTLLYGYDYKLVIDNNKTGEKVTAVTKIIKDFSFSESSYWNAEFPKISFYNNGEYKAFKHALWNSAINGRRYQLTIRFHYREKDLNTGVETDKHLDWVFSKMKSQNLEGGDEMGFDIDGEEFYKYVASTLDPVSSSNNVKRCIGDLDFIVSVAGEEFNTYLEVNEPTTGIVQERPEYTNVFDAKGKEQAGFFSARYAIMETGGRFSTSGISGNSVTELKNGTYTTANYGFVTKVDVTTCPL